LGKQDADLEVVRREKSAFLFVPLFLPLIKYLVANYLILNSSQTRGSWVIICATPESLNGLDSNATFTLSIRPSRMLCTSVARTLAQPLQKLVRWLLRSRPAQQFQERDVGERAASLSSTSPVCSMSAASGSSSSSPLL